MRIALEVEYDGSGYHGWQRQAGCASVQAEVEAALGRVAAAPVVVVCAGRTDAGVHATGQVVHCEIPVQRPLTAWTHGVNRYLPAAIKIRWSQGVPEHFHARFCAVARHYRYLIDNSPWRPALWHQGITSVTGPLDANLMHQAGQALVGEHDFSSFRARHCQSNSPWRNIMQLSVTRQGNYVIVHIKANAFVHHMVRNIVGALLQVGRGQYPPAWIGQVLALRDRSQAAETAKPQGLYLVRVEYPPIFNLPTTPLGPWLLTDE